MSCSCRDWPPPRGLPIHGSRRETLKSPPSTARPPSFQKHLFSLASSTRSHLTSRISDKSVMSRVRLKNTWFSLLLPSNCHYFLPHGHLCTTWGCGQCRSRRLGQLSWVRLPGDRPHLHSHASVMGRDTTHCGDCITFMSNNKQKCGLLHAVNGTITFQKIEIEKNECWLSRMLISVKKKWLLIITLRVPPRTSQFFFFPLSYDSWSLGYVLPFLPISTHFFKYIATLKKHFYGWIFLANLWTFNQICFFYARVCWSVQYP